MISRILRVDADSGIGHDGLGTGRGYDYVVVSGIAGPVGHLVAQVVELGLGLLVDHLVVAHSGQGLGVPVDHPHAAVDISFLVEINECVDDSLTESRIHRKAGTVPVAGCPEFLELLEDDAAVLLLPFPGMFHELLAGQGGLVDALLLQLGHHLGLGGDGRMVGTRHPAGVLALHAGTADEHVLYRIVEHVSHVQHTCHIGRRDDHSIWFPVIGFRMEKLVFQPVRVPFLLYFQGTVFSRQFHCILKFKSIYLNKV